MCLFEREREREREVKGEWSINEHEEDPMNMVDRGGHPMHAMP